MGGKTCFFTNIAVHEKTIGDMEDTKETLGLYESSKFIRNQDVVVLCVLLCFPRRCAWKYIYEVFFIK